MEKKKKLKKDEVNEKSCQKHIILSPEGGKYREEEKKNTKDIYLNK